MTNPNHRPKVQSIISGGTQSTIVDIECHLSNSLPNIIIVGSVSKAVDEARERLRGSFATSHLMLPRKRITVNLAPADVPKSDSGFDLAIAVAILLAGGEITTDMPNNQAFIGELGLDGRTRPVRGLIGKILFGRTKGINRYFIPAANIGQASLIPDIEIVAIESLTQLYGFLCLGLPLDVLRTGKGKKLTYLAKLPSADNFSLSEIVGHDRAKRVLQICAAGGHNLLFYGPPGTGKSMLSKSLTSIMPPLNREEILETTHLHSLSSMDFENIVPERPFRSPHHSSSYISMIGGGPNLKPGEISLAHNGILFLDELPEFNRFTIEALRQPLEDRVINLSRSRASINFPAGFTLVATANPCPCGYYNSSTNCLCSSAELGRYRSRISGPILDRIDLFCEIKDINHEQLLVSSKDEYSDNMARENVKAARDVQLTRNKKASGGKMLLNSALPPELLRTSAMIAYDAIDLLNKFAKQNNLSARGYMRTLKVARTIADLDSCEGVSVTHVTEALSYRNTNFLGANP